MSIEYERIEVTPAMAKKWLRECNVHNRRMRADNVEAMARDIVEGKWQENGDTIRFAEDGALLDGQHRLAAVLEANTSIMMLIVTGLPNRSQDTIDGGARRSLGDVLLLQGESDVNVLAAVLRRSLTYVQNPHHHARGFNRAQVHTVAECLDFLRLHPELRAYVKAGRLNGTAAFIPAATMAFCHWQFAMIDESDASEFMHRLASGAGVPEGDPILQMRERARQMARSTSRAPSWHYTALIIKAWNAWRLGQTMQILSFKGGGAAPERFPTPI